MLVRGPTLAAVVALLLAGCADPAPPAAEGAAPAGLGTLRGLVVDEAVRPLAGATVTATGNSGTLNGTTGADGLFQFDGLAPGVYLVEVTKATYSSHQQAVDVREGTEAPLAKFQLSFQADSVPYANLYKYDGFYECGLYGMRVCSNINILTWVVLCQYGLCLGNITNDRSLFFQYVEAGPQLIQTELTWTPTSAAGEAFAYLIGGGNEEELRGGVGLPAFNGTYGPSPLMLRISNHEAEDTWCKRNNQDCETPRTLDGSGIGTTRALLVQIDTGPVVEVPGCAVPGTTMNPCGAGAVVQQPFTMYTTVFYGYEPGVDWRFTAEGRVPPP
jgi:hypothetical protein